MANRKEKIQEELHHAAAEFLARESNRQSMITVTHAAISDDARRATLYITVLPLTAQTALSAEDDALAFVQRKRGDLADYFRERVRGAYPPHIEFMIDRGEKNRQRLDELS